MKKVYPEYFYPKNDLTKSKNCFLDQFFEHYALAVMEKSNIYLARLPAFGQCISKEK